METRSLKEYDDELFFLFKSAFSIKFEAKFKNQKLYNTWGRKCNFIIKILKNAIYTKKNDIPKIINILIEFLSSKETYDGLQYLSAFDYNVYKNHKQEMLTFRNGISSYLFTEINLLYDSNTGEIMKRLKDSLETFFEEYTFLKNLFGLLQYSLDDSVDIYEEFMLLLNNNNIIEKIIENNKCTLNHKQKAFLQQQNLDLAECDNLLNELKGMTLTNEEMLLDILSTKCPKKKKNKKNKNKGSKEDNKIMNLNPTSSKNAISQLSLEKKDENSAPFTKEDNSSTYQLNIEQKKDKESNDIIDKNKEIISENEECENNEINLVNNAAKQISYEDNVNESPNLSLQEKVKIIEEQNKILIKKMDSYELLVKSYEKQVKSYEKQVKSYEKKVKSYEKKLESNEEEMVKIKDSFQNKIDILDSKIGMICYRDLIKDLINYSFDFFKCPKEKNIKLWRKVEIIEDTMLSSKNNIASLNNSERKEFSNFINISFLALKNVNHNVHGDLYISNYSIEDFLQCFQNYISLYDVELLKSTKKVKIVIPSVKIIKTILNKIGFVGENDFANDDNFSNDN